MRLTGIDAAKRRYELVVAGMDDGRVAFAFDFEQRAAHRYALVGIGNGEQAHDGRELLGRKIVVVGDRRGWYDEQSNAVRAGNVRERGQRLRILADQ